MHGMDVAWVRAVDVERARELYAEVAVRVMDAHKAVTATMKAVQLSREMLARAHDALARAPWPTPGAELNRPSRVGSGVEGPTPATGSWRGERSHPGHVSG